MIDLLFCAHMKIKELRQANNLTLRELSDKTGISPATLSRYERFGIGAASVANAATLAQVFQCSLGTFVKGTTGLEMNERSVLVPSLEVDIHVNEAGYYWCVEYGSKCTIRGHYCESAAEASHNFWQIPSGLWDLLVMRLGGDA